MAAWLAYSKMRPMFVRGNQRTMELLLEMRTQAAHDGQPRVARRFHGIALSMEGRTVSEIARVLNVHRSSALLWIEHWNQHQEQGLLEGHRSGRPSELTTRQRQQLQDILDRGPVAYGLETGIWTSPVISQVIQEEFRVKYHPGHVRRMLKQRGYSVQRPTTRLVQTDPVGKSRWIRYPYPCLKKSPNRRGGDRVRG